VSSQVRAQCTVANCPAGSNIVEMPPYIGTNAVDCFIGTPASDTMLGRGGDDYLCGGGGNDTIAGGAGDDIILGEDGDDNLQGDGDADVILGGNGADTIDGGAGDDFLFGEADSDTLRGGPGDDALDGADGNDILEGEAGADSLSGGDGNDQLEGGSGNDPTLDGGPGEDTINGGAGDDTANGGPGLDFINGGQNDDTLSGGDGPDIINGDGGNDTLNGNADNDTLDGGNGTDLLFGNSGLDVCLNAANMDLSCSGLDVCLNAANMDLSCELFTHATLESFSAFEDGGSVVVRWVTSSEAGTVGFYLSREVNREWEALHEGLLPGLLDAPQGGVYNFRDDGGDPNTTQRYLLTEVDLHGVQSAHGPFDVIPDQQGESLLEDDSSYARQERSIAAIGPTLKAAGSEKQRAGAPVAIYLGVEKTGLYVVSAAEIAARLGLDEVNVSGRIQAGELLLTEAGEAVAWSGPADGSELAFFGLERESLYTTERVYRLSLDSGATMAEEPAAPGTVISGLEYEGRLHIEENQIPGVLVAQVLAVDLRGVVHAGNSGRHVRPRGRHGRRDATGRSARHHRRGSLGGVATQRDACWYDSVRRRRATPGNLPSSLRSSKRRREHALD
jgi:hypothetical protein